MTAALTLSNFEAALQVLINHSKEMPAHFVLNCHSSLRDAVEAILMPAIQAATSGVLASIDLRRIYHSQGNRDNWSLEACSKDKSLAMVGEVPTA